MGNPTKTHKSVQTAINTRGLVKSVHVSNNYGEREQHLPPDDGIIDIKRAFMALRENGYTGPCNLEFRFGEEYGLPSVELLRDVRVYMEKLLWNRD
jgi:sugar phosphate isomerase/epimerase